MDTSNIINLVAAILVGGGTLALAFTAWKSIRQTRSIQRAEKRERLLNEIIEWAVAVAKVGTETRIPIGVDVSTERMVRVTVTNILFEYEGIRARSRYVRNVALFFGDILNNAVKTVIDNIDKHMDALAKPSDDKDYKDMARESGKLLQASINTLVEEIVRIKIKEIG